MKDNKGFYRTILDHIPSGVYFVDQERTITFWNRGAALLSGYSAEEVVGKKCSEFLNHIDEDGKVLCGDGCPLLATLSDGEPRQAEVYMLHKMGQRVPVLVQAMPMNESDLSVGAVEIFHDISPLRLAEARIQKLTDEAYQDALTGVYNRRGIEQISSHWFSDYLQTGYPFGVVFLDVDDFKQINDTYGHLVGDQILSLITDRLKQNLRQFDMVGRWGGDEFLILLREVSGETITKVVRKIEVFLNEEQYITEGGHLPITCSLGGGVIEQNESLINFLHRADKAMYAEKKTKQSSKSE
jgi:diguanylate cyclase (GGDEF)-like protein/PAS domain S-box-containing protein